MGCTHRPWPWDDQCWLWESKTKKERERVWIWLDILAGKYRIRCKHSNKVLQERECMYLHIIIIINSLFTGLEQFLAKKKKKKKLELYRKPLLPLASLAQGRGHVLQIRRRMSDRHGSGIGWKFTRLLCEFVTCSAVARVRFAGMKIGVPTEKQERAWVVKRIGRRENTGKKKQKVPSTKEEQARVVDGWQDWHPMNSTKKAAVKSRKRGHGRRSAALILCSISGKCDWTTGSPFEMLRCYEIFSKVAPKKKKKKNKLISRFPRRAFWFPSKGWLQRERQLSWRAYLHTEPRPLVLCVPCLEDERQGCPEWNVVSPDSECQFPFFFFFFFVIPSFFLPLLFLIIILHFIIRLHTSETHGDSLQYDGIGYLS